MCGAEKSNCNNTQQRELEMYDIHVYELRVCVCVPIIECNEYKIVVHSANSYLKRSAQHQQMKKTEFSYYQADIWQIVMFHKGPDTAAHSVGEV